MALSFSSFRSFLRYQRHRRTNRSCLPGAKLILSFAPTFTGEALPAVSKRVTLKALVTTGVTFPTVVPGGIFPRAVRLLTVRPTAIASGFLDPAASVNCSGETDAPGLVGTIVALNGYNKSFPYAGQVVPAAVAFCAMYRSDIFNKILTCCIFEVGAEQGAACPLRGADEA